MLKISLLLCILYLAIAGYAQIKTDNSLNKVTISAGFSRYAVFNSGQSTPNFRIESAYNFTKLLGAGLYLGAGKSAHDHKIDRFSASYYYYGLQGTLHLLPFIHKMNKSRFDLFVPIKTGRIHQKYNEYKSSGWQYSGGLGLAYYFNKHLGIYTEGNLIFGSNWKINTDYTSPIELRFGLSMKIK